MNLVVYGHDIYSDFVRTCTAEFKKIFCFVPKLVAVEVTSSKKTEINKYKTPCVSLTWTVSVMFSRAFVFLEKLFTTVLDYRDIKRNDLALYLYSISRIEFTNCA